MDVAHPLPPAPPVPALTALAIPALAIPALAIPALAIPALAIRHWRSRHWRSRHRRSRERRSREWPCRRSRRAGRTTRRRGRRGYGPAAPTGVGSVPGVIPARRRSASSGRGPGADPARRRRRRTLRPPGAAAAAPAGPGHQGRLGGAVRRAALPAVAVMAAGMVPDWAAFCAVARLCRRVRDAGRADGRPAAAMTPAPTTGPWSRNGPVGLRSRRAAWSRQAVGPVGAGAPVSSVSPVWPGRARPVPRGAPGEVGGTDDAGVRPELRPADLRLLAGSPPPVSAFSKAARAGPSSSSPASDTPPPTTKHPGSRIAARSARPCPSQVPTIEKQRSAAGSPSRGGLGDLRAADPVRAPPGQLKQPHRRRRANAWRSHVPRPPGRCRSRTAPSSRGSRSRTGGRRAPPGSAPAHRPSPTGPGRACRPA